MTWRLRVLARVARLLGFPVTLAVVNRRLRLGGFICATDVQTFVNTVSSTSAQVADAMCHVQQADREGVPGHNIVH